jgi:hypothetical protein
MVITKVETNSEHENGPREVMRTEFGNPRGADLIQFADRSPRQGRLAIGCSTMDTGVV